MQNSICYNRYCDARKTENEFLCKSLEVLTMRTITRRMDAVLNELDDEFKALYTMDDFENTINELKENENTSRKKSIVKKLKKMLKNSSINFDETSEDIAYYENLIEQNRSNIAETVNDVTDSMIYKLYTKFQEYPTPEEYMKRIVDKLCNKEDGWENDTLRLRILKQFIKYGNYLKDAGFGGRMHIRRFVANTIRKRLNTVTDEDVWNYLSDKVFDSLNDANDDQRNPEAKRLLKVADDLATGKFRAEGATKKSLYLFAMVFNMTYHCGEDNSTVESDTLRDYDSDIVKNLFNDYYSNNLMRFLTEDYRGRRGEFEREPSGQGINYKNFAEMVYLYYISKDYTPEEKIKLSNKMINSLKRTQIIENPPLQHESDDGETEYYKELFSEDILRLEEAEFEKFICENYNHDTNRGTHRIGVLQLKTEQQSAFLEYQGILNMIDEKYRRIGIRWENSDCYVICDLLNPDDEDTIIRFNDIRKKHKDINDKKFEEFKELLRSINSFMSYNYFESISNKNVSRTSMIAAWYHYFNLKKTEENKDTRLSFQEVFDEFNESIKYHLAQSNYQPLNGKNIFDVMMVFASYLYINTIDK